MSPRALRGAHSIKALSVASFTNSLRGYAVLWAIVVHKTCQLL